MKDEGSAPLTRSPGAPLLRFLAPDQETQRRILIDASSSGVANAALLVVTNMAATKGGTLLQMGMFVILFGLYVICFRSCFNRVTMLFEVALERKRTDVANTIRALDLRGLDQLEQTTVYNRLTQQTTIISDAAGVLAASLQSAVLVVFTAAYLASMSIPAFVLTTLVIGGGILIYVARSAEVNAGMRETSKREMGFFESISDLLGGFKEIKLSQRRSNALYARLSSLAAAVRDLKIRTADLFNTNYIFAYSLFYGLIGVLVFVMPNYQSGDSADVMRLTAIVLFIIGPLSTVIAGIPALSKSSLAATEIALLEADIARLGQRTIAAETGNALVERPKSFSTIELRDVGFHYEGNAERFGVGPINLTIQRGEILFITGGNGSGKSTLLKLLCALYRPDAGQHLLDDVPVELVGSQAYREMFSAIFSDFHLFKTLDGEDTVDPATVQSLLQLMQIDSKTRFEDGGFSTLSLSTGQRKRLALVVTLLENRPVLIFDEWAADQDPEFRRYFYEQLLGDLKRQGKTIIAVTHDEHYLHHADRLVKMEYGQIEPMDWPHRNPAPGTP